jgi:hypothetical protein
MSPQLIRIITVGLKYLLAIAGFATLQTLAIQSMVTAPDKTILIDALFHAAIYAGIAVLIFNTLKFGRFQALHIIQQLLIYIALTGLALLIVALAGYVLHTKIFQEDLQSDFFSYLLPLRLFLSFLVMIMIILYAHLKISNEKSEKIINETPVDEIIAESKTIVTNTLDSIAVKSGQKIHVIAISDIIYLQADGDYVQIVTEKGKYLKEQTLKYFEENLPQALFVRIHRSYIVHVQAIARIELYDKQNQQLSLKNGAKLKISQSGYKTLRSRLNL